MTTVEIERETTDSPPNDDDLCHIFMDRHCTHVYCGTTPRKKDPCDAYYVGQAICPCGREICSACVLMANMDVDWT